MATPKPVKTRLFTQARAGDFSDPFFFPSVLPEFDVQEMERQGFRTVDPTEFTQFAKQFQLRPEGKTFDEAQRIFGIQANVGESLFDFLQRKGESTKTTRQFKSLLTEPQIESDQFDVGGVLKTREAAFATPAQRAQDASTLRKIQGEQKAEQERLGKLPSQAGQKFKPTQFSISNNLADLQRTVFEAPSGVAANKEFVNAVFKAFHNRDATEQELDANVGKNVQEVRTEIVGGAQAAGLPTVSRGTVDVPTGILTPEEAEEQGLQKVLRPDQLSAFTEEQIIRDNRGGIYLNPETTTTSQQESVASGESGNQIAKIKTPITQTDTIRAESVESSINAPDPESFTDIFLGSEESGDTTNQKNTIIDTANDYLSGVIDSLDSVLDDINTQISTAQEGLGELTTTVSGLATGTPNLDAFNIEKATILAKQADLVDIQKQIANEKARLNLGIVKEADKLAPLSIIGRRQATLEAQGMARIGALTSIAQVLQDDLDFAKDMADATVSAMNKDRELQLNAIDTLIDLKENEIIRLSDEENDILDARKDLLTKAMDVAQENADKIFDLIKDNPQAAIKGKVSFNDAPEVALAKMAPHITEDEKLRTQVIDLGNRKALINLNTGEEIRSFAETGGGVGTGGARLTQSQFNSASGKFLQANPDKTVQDFKNLTASDQLIWLSGGPEVGNTEQSFLDFSEDVQALRDTGLSRKEALDDLESEAELTNAEQKLFDEVYPEEAGQGFFSNIFQKFAGSKSISGIRGK